jgi:HSP20 family protein
MPPISEELRQSLSSLRQSVEGALARLRREDDREMRVADTRPIHQGPDLDLEDRGDVLVLRAELPGMEPKDLDILVGRDAITLNGEKTLEKEERNGDFYRRERRFGFFSRRLQLPVEVDPDGARAMFKSGVLELSMPKTAEGKSQQKRIAVRAV